MNAAIPAAATALSPATGPTLPPPRLDRPARDSVRRSVLGAWARTDMLFGAVTRDRDLLAQPDPLRNPLIFYLGHAAAFYINKLRLAGLLGAGVVPAFERLFERGVDPARARDLARLTYPDPADVWRYRDAARDVVLATIDDAPWDRPVTASDPRWGVLMALEHDRIHFETSSVLLRQLPVAALTRPVGFTYADPHAGHDDVDERAVVRVPGGRVQLGKPASSPTFGWDNEYGALLVDVAPFEARRDLVTNGELLRFVRAGGYARDALWSDAGRAWKDEQRRRHPRFWVPDASASAGFRYRALFDELALPLAWPAEVNAHEAAAYARWLATDDPRGGGFRLPTEAEHALLAAGAPERDGDVITCDAYNICLRVGSPTPVGASGATSRWGCRDVRGNVWQWLADDFYPLPGFRPHPYYEDFSTPYFGRDHGMMTGGSWASTGASASRYYRLWFRRNFYQHAGFRLVRAAP